MFEGGKRNLELFNGEAAAGTHTAVVLGGGASHDGAQEIDGPRRYGGSLGDAGLATAQLTAGLVEMCPHATLPLLAEVVGRELLESDSSAAALLALLALLSHPPLFSRPIPTDPGGSQPFQYTMLLLLFLHC